MAGSRCIIILFRWNKMKFLEQPIHSLKGVGVKRAQLYEKLGVLSVYSLLTYYPRDYIDFTHPKQTQS